MASYDINNVEDKEIVVYISPNGYGKKVFELEQRIDKAIEELEMWDTKNKVIQLEIKLLLDILRGEDK